MVLLVLQVYGQDTTSVQEPSTREKVAIYSTAGILVPLAVAGLAISFFPPSAGVVLKDGTAYGSFDIETGFGYGEKRETGIFTNYRVMLNYTHIGNAKVRDIFRTEVTRDFNFDFIDRRKIFLSGIHVSTGFISDFPNHGYTIGTGVWLKSPWLPYFGLFPSHTYGLTYRYNSFFSGKSFHEISLGVTSAFTF